MRKKKSRRGRDKKDFLLTENDIAQLSMGSVKSFLEFFPQEEKDLQLLKKPEEKRTEKHKKVIQKAFNVMDLGIKFSLLYTYIIRNGKKDEFDKFYKANRNIIGQTYLAWAVHKDQIIKEKKAALKKKG